MFLPINLKEFKKKFSGNPDVIIVSGDTYIDSPYDGAAVIGKWLIANGYSVALLPQPDIRDSREIMQFGSPNLFWGVSGGSVDSMVANYTALKKKKKSDDLTPGGKNTRRPDRAVLRYVNLIKSADPQKKPVVIGGIEASLRRLAHYDFWSDKIRGSILVDSKADYLVYGMGERAILEIAEKINTGEDCSRVRGICYADSYHPDGYREISSLEDCRDDPDKFIDMFHEFYKNNDPKNAVGLAQKHGKRFVIQNPPQPFLESAELDQIHELPFEYDAHPVLKKQGEIKALATIGNSVTTHRGCYGECNFCAITVHQGRKIRSRTEDSILREIKTITKTKNFKGIINDLGGPTANMYGNTCKKQDKSGSCKKKRCLSPEKCPVMNISHARQVRLLRKASEVPEVKKVLIGSGLRYDLVLADDEHGETYLKKLAGEHVGGQLKIAPEHADDSVLNLMGKPAAESLEKFREEFLKASQSAGKKQFLTYYFIAAHPGCENYHMQSLSRFAGSKLKLNPEQVQIFTPTPSTYSTLMYATGKDPFSDSKLFVEKGLKGKRIQKEIVSAKKRNR